MSKTVLIICDHMPHILEYMEPAINEARRRGYEVAGACFGVPSKDALARLGITDVSPFRGVWDQKVTPPVLSVPQADAILQEVKPRAVFIDITGVGHAGGPWLERANTHGITAIEFGGGRSRVYRFGKKAQDVTDQYIDQLRKVGYGQHSDGLLAGTGVWQWVGLNVGDRLREPLDKMQVRRALGLPPKEKYVAFMGNWGVGPGYANMASADLSEWDERAREHGLALVYSPHPTCYYAKLAVQHVPKTTTLTANFPGAVLGGRKAKVARTFDLIRLAEFVIFQYTGNTQALALAARVPMWLRRRSSGRMDPAKFSREPWDRAEKDKVQTFPKWPYADRLYAQLDRAMRDASAYRTASELELLFDGKLRFPGSERQRAKWDEEWRLRLDGKTAKRIIDLIG